MIPRGIEALAGQHIREGRKNSSSQNAAHLNQLERSRMHYNRITPITRVRRVVGHFLQGKRQSSIDITPQQFEFASKFRAPSKSSLNERPLANEIFESMVQDLGDVEKTGARIIFESEK